MKIMDKKKIIKGICFVLIFCVLFSFFQKLLQAKWITGDDENPASTSSWREFRSLDEDSLDVLFIGTSHSYSAVDPMCIYDRTGITSYVFGGPGLRFDLTYMNLEDALKTQNPQVVFLDMSAIQFDFQQTEAKSHKVLDQFPISISKIEYAFNNGNEDMKPLDALFPFFRYHARWSELGKEDFKYVLNDLDATFIRGHYVSFKITETAFDFYEDKEFVLTDRNLDYLKRMKKICDEKNIELVLYKIPSPEWSKTWSNASEKIAEELGLAYLELFYEVEKIGIDANTDFRDKVDHMNQYGSEKLSNYLADYLVENYNLRDQRSTNRRWNEDLAKYKELVRAKEAEKTQEQEKVK